MSNFDALFGQSFGEDGEGVKMNPGNPFGRSGTKPYEGLDRDQWEWWNPELPSDDDGDFLRKWCKATIEMAAAHVRAWKEQRGQYFDLNCEVARIIGSLSNSRAPAHEYMMEALSQTMVEMGYSANDQDVRVFDVERARKRLERAGAPPEVVEAVPNPLNTNEMREAVRRMEAEKGIEVPELPPTLEIDFGKNKLSSNPFESDDPEQILGALRELFGGLGVEGDITIINRDTGQVVAGSDVTDIADVKEMMDKMIGSGMPSQRDPIDDKVRPDHECTGEEAHKWITALVDLAEHKKQYHGWVGSVPEIAVELAAAPGLDAEDMPPLATSILIAVRDELFMRGYPPPDMKRDDDNLERGL